MPYPAIVVANEIIKLANAEKVEITPMKLQKILYLANGINYKRKSEKLVKEKFEAWDYGPVIRTVYNTYRDCKGNNIDEPIDDMIHTNGFSFVKASTIQIEDSDFTVIKEAWDNSKNLDAFTLSAWSHNKDSPWDKAFNSNPKSLYISDEDIHNYFNGFIR